MIWTRDFAYGIGLLTTDGNLSKDGRHLSFVSKDLEQIQNFLYSLKIDCKISLKASSRLEDKKYFFVQFSNVKLYKYLQTIGLHPRKSKSLEKIHVPDRGFTHFLRGCFDGDGYSYSYWDKRWKSSFMFYIGFVSASKKHLEWVRDNVSQLFGIEGKINLGTRSYLLKYAKNSSMALVKEIYRGNNITYLKRKRFKIDQALGIIRHNQGRVV